MQGNGSSTYENWRFRFLWFKIVCAWKSHGKICWWIQSWKLYWLMTGVWPYITRRSHCDVIATQRPHWLFISVNSIKSSIRSRPVWLNCLIAGWNDWWVTCSLISVLVNPKLNLNCCLANDNLVLDSNKFSSFDKNWFSSRIFISKSADYISRRNNYHFYNINRAKLVNEKDFYFFPNLTTTIVKILTVVRAIILCMYNRITYSIN